MKVLTEMSWKSSLMRNCTNGRPCHKKGDQSSQLEGTETRKQMTSVIAVQRLGHQVKTELLGMKSNL